MALSFMRFPMAMERASEMRLQKHRMHDENEKEYMFSLVLPVARKEQIELEIVGNNLVVKAQTVQGRNKFEVKEKFTIPKDGDHKKLEAEFTKGVLKVKVPKTEPLRVAVQNDGWTDEDAYIVSYRVPGAGPQDISVEILDGVLSVKAAREKNSPRSSFQRNCSVPVDARVAEARAFCRNGIVTVSVPKVEPERVEIAQSLPLNDSMYTISMQALGIETEQITLLHVKNQFRLVVHDMDEAETVLSDNSFTLPLHVDITKVVAVHRNGILTIAAPKKGPESRKVTVTDAPQMVSTTQKTGTPIISTISAPKKGPERGNAAAVKAPQLAGTLRRTGPGGEQIRKTSKSVFSIENRMISKKAKAVSAKEQSVGGRKSPASKQCNKIDR